MEFDEVKFQDEVELMNIDREARQSQIDYNETFGFNSDVLYNFIENKN